LTDFVNHFLNKNKMYKLNLSNLFSSLGGVALAALAIYGTLVLFGVFPYWSRMPKEAFGFIIGGAYAGAYINLKRFF
jgi:hypothetical protein